MALADGVDDLGIVTVLRQSGIGKAITVDSNSGINRTWDISITGAAGQWDVPLLSPGCQTMTMGM